MKETNTEKTEVFVDLAVQAAVKCAYDLSVGQGLKSIAQFFSTYFLKTAY